MKFRKDQIDRYSRQIILDEVGGIGQENLLNSKVLIIGAGGLGSPCALYLAAAGVGEIGIVDSDKVELNNLQRQILYSEKDIGKSKVCSFKNRLSKFNKDTKIISYETRLTSKNIMEILSNYDFVVDGSDNFPTKYLINDACIFTNKPFSHGGILQFFGQTFTILPHRSACLRCLFPEPPQEGIVPNCQQAGVLGTIAGLIGIIQANEVLKYILKIGKLLENKLLMFDALDNDFQIINISKNTRCPVCGKNPSITRLYDYKEICDQP